MKKWTEEMLRAEGYRIWNAVIKNVDLVFDECGYIHSKLFLDGHGLCVDYGANYILGIKTETKTEYGRDSKFSCTSAGMEAIMRILDAIGEDNYCKLKGKYVRVATKRLGSVVNIIGNILDDKWFDYKSFFDDMKNDADDDNCAEAD